METKKQEMIDRLRQYLMGWEGFRPLPPEERQEFGLGAIESAFPNKIFPTGALHEFISTRPEFTAQGGYAGTQTLTALSKRYPRLWVGAYMRYDTLAGAAFVDSPLVQRKSYWTGGFGFAWMIQKSAQVVQIPD